MNTLAYNKIVSEERQSTLTTHLYGGSVFIKIASKDGSGIFSTRKVGELESLVEGLQDLI